jgi:hypothetical protein
MPAQALWQQGQEEQAIEKARNPGQMTELEKMLAYQFKPVSGGIGNPNPGGGTPYRHQYPTAMTDSGQYLAADQVPGSNTMNFEPDNRVLYQIRQLMNQRRNMQGI